MMQMSDVCLYMKELDVMKGTLDSIVHDNKQPKRLIKSIFNSRRSIYTGRIM